MDASKEAVKVLTSMLPGFLFLKVVALESSVSKYEAHHYLVDALIASLVIYSVVAFLDWIISLMLDFQIMAPVQLRIFVTLLLTIVMVLLWSVAINRDWLAKWLHRRPCAGLGDMVPSSQGHADRLQGDRWLAMAGHRGRCGMPHPCVLRSIGSDRPSRLQVGESFFHLQSGDFRYARRNDLHFLEDVFLVDLPCRKGCRANAKIHAALG